MAERIVDGNYNAFGVNKINDELVFTFEGEKEAKCAIRLYERKANGTFRDIPVPEESCIGAVRSIGIQGLDWKKYNYNLIIDGKELVDPYARKIVGREKWADFSRKNKDYKEALRFGSAAGSASAFSESIATKEKVEELLKEL